MIKSSLASAIILGLGLISSDRGPQSTTVKWSGDIITAIEVNDLEKSLKWYQDTFGFKIVLDLRDMGWIELESPVKGFVIGLSAKKTDAEFQNNGGSKLSFGVQDIQAVRKYLIQKGVEVPEILEIPNTVKLLEFRDLDGNNLMLHQAVSSDN